MSTAVLAAKGATHVAAAEGSAASSPSVLQLQPLTECFCVSKI